MYSRAPTIEEEAPYPSMVRAPWHSNLARCARPPSEEAQEPSQGRAKAGMEYSTQFDHAELPTAGEDFVGVGVRATLALCALCRQRRVVGGTHQQVGLVVGRIVCRGWGGSGLGAYIRVGRALGVLDGEEREGGL